MDWFKDLLEFLWAVINNWAGYATGGLVVALLWLWSTLRQVPISRKIGIVIAVVFLFVAFFNAWREKHHLALAAQAQLEELTKPKLTAEYGSALATSEANSADSLMTLSGVIKNQGAPTILDNWAVDLELPNRTIHATILFTPPPSQTLTMADENGNPMFTLSGSQYWLRTTRSAP